VRPVRVSPGNEHESGATCDESRAHLQLGHFEVAVGFCFSVLGTPSPARSRRRSEARPGIRRRCLTALPGTGKAFLRGGGWRRDGFGAAIRGGWDAVWAGAPACETARPGSALLSPDGTAAAVPVEVTQADLGGSL